MYCFLKETYYVAWGDFKFMRHNVVNIIISSIMSPLLYLLAFGFGLGMGKGIEIDGVPYTAFIIPGIAALTSLSASFGAVSTRLNVQRLYYRSLDEMLMCPIGISSIVLGKSLQGVLRGLVSSTIIFAIGLALYPDYLQVSPLYVVSIVLSCFTFSFLGVAAALLANTHQAMATFSNLVILPMTFLAGTFFAVGSLPTIFRAALYVLPLTHSSATARAASLGESFPIDSFIVLSVFCIAFFVISVYKIKSKRV